MVLNSNFFPEGKIKYYENIASIYITNKGMKISEGSWIKILY